MPLNGSGGVTQPAGGFYPPVANTLIESAKVAISWADVYSILATALYKDGQQVATARIPFAAGISTDTVTEKTSDTGVTLDSVLLKDGRIDTTQGADIVCAATINLETATGNVVDVTGSTGPVTAITLSQGHWRLVRFTGTPTLTHGASLVLPGAANITVEAGDCAIFAGFASSVVRCLHYMRGTGAALNFTNASNEMCNGRLTLTSGTPVTTSDVTAAETIYFTPFRGNRIDLFDGTNWKRYTFTELPADVPDATQMNDVFVYDNAGTLTLDVVAWTNDTTRATALATQNGVLVKTGATGRRYVGSFYSTTAGNGQTEDSLANRYVWNYYNRARKSMRVVDTTDTWTYSTAAFQQARASTANQLNMAIGVSEDAVEARVQAGVFNSTATPRRVTVGIGIDSTTVNSAQIFSGAAVDNVRVWPTFAAWNGYPGIGKRFVAWLEMGFGGETQTWVGDNAGTDQQSGIVGTVLC